MTDPITTGRSWPMTRTTTDPRDRIVATGDRLGALVAMLTTVAPALGIGWFKSGTPATWLQSPRSASASRCRCWRSGRTPCRAAGASYGCLGIGALWVALTLGATMVLWSIAPNHGA